MAYRRRKTEWACGTHGTNGRRLRDYFRVFPTPVQGCESKGESGRPVTGNHPHVTWHFTPLFKSDSVSGLASPQAQLMSYPPDGLSKSSYRLPSLWVLLPLGSILPHLRLYTLWDSNTVTVGERESQKVTLSPTAMQERQFDCWTHPGTTLVYAKEKVS